MKKVKFTALLTVYEKSNKGRNGNSTSNGDTSNECRFNNSKNLTSLSKHGRDHKWYTITIVMIIG